MTSTSMRAVRECWVARMAGEMGAHPILCGFSGGETGELLRPLLEALPGETRLVETAAASGSWVIDRRSGDREMIAHAWSDPPSRHEIDDLFSITCAAALDSEVLVVCGPVPTDALALEIYENLVADVSANGTKVIVDLSSPRLDSALKGGPDVVKLSNWQLAEFADGDVSDPGLLRERGGAGAGAGSESGAGHAWRRSRARPARRSSVGARSTTLRGWRRRGQRRFDGWSARGDACARARLGRRAALGSSGRCDELPPARSRKRLP